MNARLRRVPVVAAVSCLLIGSSIGVALGGTGKDEGGQPPPNLEEVVQASGASGPSELLVLETCEDVKLRGGELPDFCAELFDRADEIRAAGSPAGAATPEDFGLVTGVDEVSHR